MMISNKDLIVDFWITGDCDMRCPFCYGADLPISRKSGSNSIKTNKDLYYQPTLETISITGSTSERRELDFFQIKKILINLKNAGVKTITIAGGEPLLRKDSPNIINLASTLGLQIYLSTNGTFLLRKYNQIMDSISILGLPLDGADSDTNIMMGRRTYHFSNIYKILYYFKKNNPKHKVKIGTIVSNLNKDDILSIGDFLFNNNEIKPPDIWRLYQFEPLKRGLANLEKYKIGIKEFENIYSQVTSRFPNHKISARTNEDHVEAYFFITPDGILQIVGDKHTSIANLLTTDSQELKILFSQYQHSVQKIYNIRNWISKLD